MESFEKNWLSFVRYLLLWGLICFCEKIPISKWNRSRKPDCPACVVALRMSRLWWSLSRTSRSVMTSCGQWRVRTARYWGTVRLHFKARTAGPMFTGGNRAGHPHRNLVPAPSREISAGVHGLLRQGPNHRVAPCWELVALHKIDRGIIPICFLEKS